MYERIIELIGENNFKQIKNSKILLVGVGGVGGFAFEALIRSGFQDITIIDKDKVEITNLNRQLVATQKTIGWRKVAVCYEHSQEINKDIQIKALDMFLNADNINTLANDYDYIIDACDTLNTKLELIRFAQNNHIKIISAMGMGNRVDASKIIITTLDKTFNDPLARNLRKLIKENHLNSKVVVVSSQELPLKKGKVNSLITSPSIAGLLIVNYIINDLIKVC